MWSAIVILNLLTSGIFVAAQDCTVLAVEDVTVKSTDVGKLHVSWKLPESISCIEKYKVCWTSGIVGNCSDTYNATDTKHNISSLDDCTDYTINVTSISKSGASNLTSDSTIGRTGPGLVTNLQVQGWDKSFINVIWDKPTDNKCNLQRYRVCWFIADEKKGCDNETDINTTNYNITGLDECVDYTIKVNAEEESQIDYWNEITPPRGPGKLPNLQDHGSEKSSLNMIWKKPDTKCDLQLYRVCWFAAGEEKKCDNVTDINTPMYNITDLKECVDYKVKVSAEKENKIVYEDEITPGRGPNNIDDLTAIQISTGQVNVTWTPPKEVPYCTLRNFFYTITWTNTKNKEKQGSVTISSSTHTIDTLEPCTEYEIAVSPRILTRTTTKKTTIRTVNQQVENLNVNSSNPGKLLVSWDHPESSSNCRKNYKVCWTDEPKDCYTTYNATVNSYEITDLSNCTDYTIKVTSKSDTPALDSFPKNITGHTGPGLVTGLNIENLNSTSVNVTWNDISNSACSVYHFKVCWTTNKRDSCENYANVTATSHQITDLDECANYSVSVSAQEKNYGEVNYTKTIQLNRAIGTVKNLQVKNNNPGILQVSWDQPDFLQNCIQNYEVCWTSNEKKCSTTKTESDKNLEISNLADCTDYNITVISISGFDVLNSTALSVKGHTGPGLVTDLSIEKLNATSVNVKWVAPSNTAECTLDHYEICWKRHTDTDGAGNCENTDPGATSYDITGLDECSNYTVNVSLREKDKVNNYSSTVNITRETGPVENLKVKKNHPGKLLISWNLPNSSTSCIENYEVCWSAEQEKCDTTNNSTVKSYEITNLPDCTNYTISVISKTSTTAPDSKPKKIEGHTGPGFIAKLWTNNVNAASAIIEWNKVSGKCVSHYKVCWTANTDGIEKCESTNNAEVTSHNITGLQECADYDIEVSAQEEKDNITYSRKTDIKRVIGQVKNVNVKSNDPGNLLVSWDLPDSFINCIKNYQVCWTSDTTECFNTSTAADRSHEITGLTACRDYTINVISKANSNVSDSEAVSKTGHTGPGLITDFEIYNLEKTSLNVKWKTLDNSKCTLDHYKVCWVPTSGGIKECKNETDPKALTYEINGLEECVDYKVQVSAQEKDEVDYEGHYGHVKHPHRGPGDVTNVTTSINSAGQLLLTWEAPKEVPPYCTLTNYTYIITWTNTKNASETGRATTIKNTYTIDKPTSCINYNVEIEVEVGPHKRSRKYSTRIHTGPAPKEVIVNETSISTNWTDSESCHNYTICIYEAGKKNTEKCENVVSGTSHTFNNLKSCKNYQGILKTTNIYDETLVSNPTDLNTKCSGNSLTSFWGIHLTIMCVLFHCYM